MKSSELLMFDRANRGAPRSRLAPEQPVAELGNRLAKSAIQPAAIPLINAIYGTRPALLEDQRLVLDWHWSAARWLPSVQIGLKAPGLEASLLLQDWHAVAPDVTGPHAASPNDAVIQADIKDEINLGLTPLIGYFERFLGKPLAIATLHLGRPSNVPLAADGVRLDFRLHRRGLKHEQDAKSQQRMERNRLQNRTRGALIIAAHALPDPGSVHQRPGPAAELRTRLGPKLPLVAARMQFSIAELKSLNPGDVIVAGLTARKDGGLEVRSALPGLGQTLVFSAYGDQLIFVGSAVTETSMSDTSNSNPLGQALDVDHLELEAQLIVGTLKLSLADLNALQPGAVLPFAMGEERSAVQVYIGDQKVATGAFVRVGERIGVRVTQNFLAQRG